MSNIRSLVSCTILSLQDSCLLYSCCKCCLSRLTQENKRATCYRCGFTCDLKNVDYRYRLSVKVSRNQDIFGVTVFGGCLNPFFGITAGDLQRCIESEKSNGPHIVQQLLIKAVEDCFIGRCVVLGLKV
ncbi:DNA damage-induced apoptosis suppressor protein [Triplophysa tibetana]|uniref:DNA damage-induced apoptosis suppressor protein n=1 Tax=Triplophysa tibetana TaxID=1572043 RepID=A0A5A9PCB9_9TELE|nr:DNA damage-induced apoptosis suppressor protein [Triplophysa tibetana]